MPRTPRPSPGMLEGPLDASHLVRAFKGLTLQAVVSKKVSTLATSCKESFPYRGQRMAHSLKESALQGL